MQRTGFAGPRSAVCQVVVFLGMRYHMKIYFFAFLLLILTSCNRDGSTSPSDGDGDKSYPTTIVKLGQSELDSLNWLLNQQLGTRYLAQIDSFGLLGYYDGQ
jgi:hypothetical protein